MGQEHVIRTLRNSIEKGKISQAYLFTGPRGTGKTSTARLLAKALNCTGGPSADIPDDCPICAEITIGNSMDVVEIDAASESGVDDVREHIVQASEFKPTSSRYKIFIIDEVHDLSIKAFDALLKTIEEPPSHVVFVLATTEYNKVPPTIRSRCQKFEFHRGTIQDLVKRLTFVAEQEGIKAEPAALTAIARMADGGYRDALTLFEQAMITGDGEVTLEHVYDQLGLVADEKADELIEAIATQNIAAIIGGIEAIYMTGRDPASIVESLLHRLSDLTRAAYQVKQGAESDAAVEAGLTATAGRIGSEKILTVRSMIAEAHKGIRDVSLPRVWLEAELVRVSQALVAPVVAPQKAVVERSAPAKPASESGAKNGSASVAPERVSASQPNLEPKHAPPPSTAVAPEGGRDEDGHWKKVVETLSSQSKTAALRLPKSVLVEDDGETVTVAFHRESDAEWVSDRAKLIQAIVAEWKSVSGQERNFRFVGQKEPLTAPSAPKVEKASVESPISGDELARKVKSTLSADDGDKNDETS